MVPLMATKASFAPIFLESKSLTVKSEIVIPLFVNGENIGQIDIDSHVLDPFTNEDEQFLEFVNQEIAKLF